MTKTRSRIALGLLLVILAGVSIYRSALLQVMVSVWHREGSAVGFLVPLLSGYMIWTKSDDLRSIETRFDWGGLVLMAVSLCVFALGVDSFRVLFPSFILFVSGVITLVLGRRAFMAIAVPILFLMAMTPVTDGLYTAVGNVTRDITFSASLWPLSVLDVPYYREGWFLELPNAKMVVNLGCSGVRYLISYFVLGIAYAYLTKKTAWGQLLVIISTIPISLVATILRLTTIFLGAHYISPMLAEYTPHLIISWAVFGAVLLVAVFLDQYVQSRRSVSRGGEG